VNFYFEYRKLSTVIRLPPLSSKRDLLLRG
jgi:hypothetical protein